MQQQIFFKAFRVFDPDQFKYLNFDDAFVFSHIPMFEDEKQFWKSKSERFFFFLPKLHEVAIRCLSVPTNSVDVKTSFSKYKNVLQDNRNSIKQENMCMYNMLCQSAVHLNGNLNLKV
jgi:hypothetical protein